MLGYKPSWINKNGPTNSSRLIKKGRLPEYVAAVSESALQENDQAEQARWRRWISPNAAEIKAENDGGSKT
jgi:hypothetical protein